jgi:hypothetical protein
MADTPKLTLPEIAEAQASKYITHNSGLRRLDALVQATVIDKDTSDAPGAPADGDMYIVGPSPSSGDEWSGHEGELAYYQSSAWLYFTPPEGWRVWALDENKLYVYTGSAWADYPTLVSFQTLSDTPAFSGSGYQLVRVNAAQSALELIANAYDMRAFFLGKPVAGQTIARIPIVRNVRIPDNFYLSVGNCEVPAGDSGGAEFSVQLNGVEFGHITFASGAYSPTFSTDASDQDFVAGNILKIVAPTPADPDLEDIGITIWATII